MLNLGGILDLSGHMALMYPLATAITKSNRRPKREDFQESSCAKPYALSWFSEPCGPEHMAILKQIVEDRSFAEAFFGDSMASGNRFQRLNIDSPEYSRGFHHHRFHRYP